MSFDGWKKVKLYEVANVQTGPFGSQLHVSDYTEFGIPVVMPVNIEDGVINTNKIARISPQTADRLSKHKVVENNIVFSRRGDVERHAFIREENTGWICGTGCLKVSFMENVYPRFISYQLLLPEKKAWLRNHAVGTTMPNLNTTILSTIEIELPCLNVQRRIASILSSLDDKIELNRQTAKTLEAIAQALFKEWFVAFNFPGATGEMQESELGPIPKGWRVGKLFAISRLVGGGTPKTSVKEYWEDGSIPWISAKDVTPNSGSFIIETEKKITELGLQKSSAKLLPKYVTIITARGTVGNYCITPEPMAISQSNYALVPIDEGNEYFLFFTVASLVTELKQRSYGTVFDTITTNSLADISIIIPTREIFQKFHLLIQPIFENILGLIQQTNTLTQLRDNLLPKLMKGKIQIQNYNNAYDSIELQKRFGMA